MKVSALVVAGLLLFPFSNVLAQEVNDAQIASIVVTANQVDIDAGKLAKSRSTNDEVKAFAELMISDHTSVNKSATDLVAKLKVSPQNNPTSQSLRAGGEKNLAHLKTLKGAAFDKSVRRSRGRVSPAGHRCARQDPDSRGNERRTEGSADQGAAGFCRAPRTREAPAVVHEQGKLIVRIATLVAALSLIVCTMGAAAGDQSQAKDAHGDDRGHAISARGADRRTRRHDRVGQQGPGSSHGDVEGRQLRFEGHSGRQVLEVHDPENGDFAYICTFHPTMKAMLRVK